MSVYVLENSDGQWLTRAGEWVYGCRTEELFSTPHRDVALNQLIELNNRDIGLRAAVVECRQDDKGRPVLSGRPNASVA